MQKIKIGLVGVSRGSGTVKPFEYYPETQITALCDLNQNTLYECAAHFDVPLSNCFTDYDAFLDAGIDAVIVGTPIQLQGVCNIKTSAHWCFSTS